MSAVDTRSSAEEVASTNMSAVDTRSSPEDDRSAVDTSSSPEEVASGSTAVLNRKLSISETIELSHEGFQAPWWLRWFEIPFRVADPKTGKKLPEACGWAMDSIGRGPLNFVGGYVGAAILRMAIKDAGGPNNTARGLLKPSSLLTATSSIVGVVAAILMPIMGALVDHTKYRRLVGIISAIIAVGMTGVQISISVERNNWFFILIVDAIQSFALLVHVAAVFAYLPDLTTDEEVMSHYTSRFFFRQYTVQLVYVCLVILSTRARGNSDSRTLDATVQTARDAAGIAFGMGCLFIGYAWIFLFRERPALSQVPEGSNLLTTGFVQVFRTGKKIWKDYHSLKWFMISLLWSPEAGTGVVLSISVTYLTVIMKFTGLDLAKATLTFMAGTMFGALFSKVMCRWINPLNSYRMGQVCLGTFIGLGALIFTGPERRNAVFGLATTWGFAFGWAYPSQRVLFCTLIPKGQEAEMMGLFTFMGQILGWLPPFVVTIMNENDVDLKWSLVVVFGFCVFAVVNTLPMGNYQEATELVARDSEEKLKSVLEAASRQGNEPASAVEEGEACCAKPVTVEVESTASA